MAVFPLIDSPCPYTGRLTEIMEGDMCRLCQRQVHDLNGMSGPERRAFLKSCKGEVCVSYSVAAGTIAAIGALAAVAVASPPAAAQPPDPSEQIGWVIVGGIKDASSAVLIEDESDAAIPELPVVYEAATGSGTAAGAKSAPPADTGKPVAK